MVLLKISLGCLALITLVTTVQMKPRNDQGKIVPRVYTIVEKNNKIELRRSESEEINKDILFDYLHDNANLEYRANNILNRENKNMGAKKRWIKRYVPHRQETPDRTYDFHNGIFFKPLIRLHKTSNLHLENVDKIPKLAKVRNELNELYTTYHLDEIRHSIKHERSYTKELGHLIQHMREVDQIIGRWNLSDARSELHRIVKTHHKIIAPKVEEMHRDILALIMGELNQHLRGGAAPILEDLCEGDHCPHHKPQKEKMYLNISEGMAISYPEEQLTEIPCALFPHQPLWNEWTSHQTLYEDMCPPGQEKIHNICATAPEH